MNENNAIDKRFGSTEPKKTYRNEIIMLLVTFLILFVLGELFFRIYYHITGKILATTEDEYCMKGNYKRLPTDKGEHFFKNFQRLGWLDDDPLLGVTFQADYNYEDVEVFIPNSSEIWRYVHAHTFNRHRMNNREEFEFKKSNNTNLRIALFGDSFTCGEDVPYNFGMGNLLKELIPPNNEVLNFCVSGRGTDMMYARYTFKAKDYHPDVVIFNILIDDLQRPFTCLLRNTNITVMNNRIIIGPRKYPTMKDFYYQYKAPSFESYLIKHAMGVYMAHTRYNKDMKRGLHLFSVMLDEMKRQTREENSSFFVTLIQENDPRPISIEYYEELKKLLLQKNIPFFDSVLYFNDLKKKYKKIDWYGWNPDYPRGTHFNPIGYALFSQGIKQMLESNNIIPPTPYYYFANFDTNDTLFLIPKYRLQNNTPMRMIEPFVKETR